jgi:hypothetical protein
VGIEVSPSVQSDWARTRRAWLRIAELFGAGNELADDELTKRLATVPESIERDVEWDCLQVRTITDPKSGRQYTAFSARNHMLSKITFGDNSYEDMLLQIKAAEDYFSQFRCYDGLAIHFLGSFEKLLAKNQSSTVRQSGPR